MKKLTRKTVTLSTALLFALACTGLALAKDKVSAGAYELFGEASLVSPGNASPTAAKLVSDDAPGYAGVDLGVPSGITFADLEKLGTDYFIQVGDCAGGSPRFQINLNQDSNNDGFLDNIFVYIGPAPNFTGCVPGQWISTGDLFQSTDARFDLSQIGGPFYGTVQDARALADEIEVVGIQLVVDGSWTLNQTILVDNIFVNNTLFTFESADTCKNGGWQLYGNTYKNQGQCVSYFAKGGR